MGAEGTPEADAEYARRRRAGGGKHVMRMWVGRMLVDGLHGYTGAQYINAAYHAPSGWANNAEMVSTGTIRATRNIEAGAEILMAYGDAYWRAWGEVKPRGRPPKRTKHDCDAGDKAERAERSEGDAGATASTSQLLPLQHRRGVQQHGGAAEAATATAMAIDVGEAAADGGWDDDEGGGGRRVAATCGSGRGGKGVGVGGNGAAMRGGGVQAGGVEAPTGTGRRGKRGRDSGERGDSRRMRWTAIGSNEFHRHVRTRHERGEGGGVT